MENPLPGLNLAPTANATMLEKLLMTKYCVKNCNINSLDLMISYLS